MTTEAKPGEFSATLAEMPLGELLMQIPNHTTRSELALELNRRERRWENAAKDAGPCQECIGWQARYEDAGRAVLILQAEAVELRRAIEDAKQEANAWQAKEQTHRNYTESMAHHMITDNGAGGKTCGWCSASSFEIDAKLEHDPTCVAAKYL